jgi:hypothetical protein
MARYEIVNNCKECVGIYKFEYNQIFRDMFFCDARYVQGVPMLWIGTRIRRIRMFLGLADPQSASGSVNHKYGSGSGSK